MAHVWLVAGVVLGVFALGARAGGLEQIKQESGVVFGESSAAGSAALPVSAMNRGNNPLALYSGRNQTSRPKGPIVVTEPINHRNCWPSDREQRIAAWITMVLPTVAMTALAAVSIFGLLPIPFAVWGALGAGLTVVGLMKAGMFWPEWPWIVVAAALGFLVPTVPVCFWGVAFGDGAAALIHRLRER